MHEQYFYPDLSRRAKYLGKGREKADYKDYHDEILEDCESRCVYCDIHLEEHGFEGMHLDHFRPQKFFPGLSSSPQNLVLSCPKCNRSKWYHWPCDKTVDAPSHDGTTGFIDPFAESRKDHIAIVADGSLSAKTGPAQYMVDLLKLNRKARVQVRRRRILKNEISNLVTECNNQIKDLVAACRSKKIHTEKALEEIERLSATSQKLNELQAEVATGAVPMTLPLKTEPLQS